MSQSESPLRAVIANIVSPALSVRFDSVWNNNQRRAHAPHALPRLAELADHAFALTDQQASCDPPNDVPSGIFTKKRQARILYSVEDRVTLPIKAVLYQDVPVVQIKRVVVNFQTEIVQCEGQPSLPIESWQIECARKEIEPYLQESLQRLDDVVWGSLSHEDRCVAWQDFLKRLESNGISSAQSQVSSESSPFFEKPCPSCEVLTTLCTSCHAVICLNWDCPVSRLIPFQSCSRDTYMATCLPCLQNAQTIPPLGQCPKCNLWFCDEELMWCLGRPKETPNQTSSSVREHPPKPIVCSYCNPGQATSKCYNRRCWSREGSIQNSSICQSCSPEGGVSCACERGWICDNCKEPPMARCFKQCKRCKRAYCVRECEYIQFCAECGQTTLCDDCAEEDQSSFAGLDGPEVQEVKLVGVCRTDSCLKKFCEECLEERGCADCHKTYCSSCFGLQDYKCRSCRGFLNNYCEGCLNKRQCRRCSRIYCGLCMPWDLCSKCGGWCGPRDSMGFQLLRYRDGGVDPGR